MPKSTAPRRAADTHARRRYVSRACLGMAAVLLLSGCSLIRGPEPQPVSCPTTGMLREGASLTRYKPNSVHDLTNVQLSANIVDVSANCVFVPEPRQVDMALGLRIIAERGAAAPAGEQQFAYIVAVTTPDQRFLSRQVYRLAATFPGNARRAGFEEVLNLNFPLKEGQTAADFRVYVSLQLQPDELNDNLQAR